MPNFEKLKVWEKSVELARKIYDVTSQGKLDKDYGMKDQMRRSAVSISANIAEGDEMDSNKQSIRYFRIAKGSCGELYTHTEISNRVGLISNEQAKYIQTECTSISGMLGNIIKARSQW
jgi:four helix bundle protein